MSLWNYCYNLYSPCNLSFNTLKLCLEPNPCITNSLVDYNRKWDILPPLWNITIFSSWSVNCGNLVKTMTIHMMELL